MWVGGGGHSIFRRRRVGAIQPVELDRRSGSIEMGLVRCIREGVGKVAWTAQAGLVAVQGAVPTSVCASRSLNIL